jgi:hypothetical protein
MPLLSRRLILWGRDFLLLKTLGFLLK